MIKILVLLLYSIGVNSSPNTGIIKFFPGCYPNDTITHTFKMDIAIDYGLYQSITNGMIGASTGQKKTEVTAQVQTMFAVGKLFFLEQLNVLLEINNIFIGNNTSPLPLSRSTYNGTCTSALGAFTETNNWNAEYNLNNAGFTTLISNCFSGVDGVSYEGSICSSSNSANVASFSYLVFFHELGHAFGALHTFENGIGTTGGIMDYGNGIYNGVIQFHPLNKITICPFLTTVIESNCKYFQPIKMNSTCGDGILEKEEQCECLNMSKKCDKCVNCKTSVECSSSNFVIRYKNTPDTVVADSSLLSDPLCCVNNVLKSKTLCGNKLNVCGVNGICTPICTQYLEWNNPNCGFNTNGCMLNGVCRWDLIFVDDFGNKNLISNLPNGTKCSSIGTCSNGICASPSETLINLSDNCNI